MKLFVKKEVDKEFGDVNFYFPLGGRLYISNSIRKLILGSQHIIVEILGGISVDIFCYPNKSGDEVTTEIKIKLYGIEYFNTHTSII